MVSSDFGRGSEHSTVVFDAEFCLVRPTRLVKQFSMCRTTLTRWTSGKLALWFRRGQPWVSCSVGPVLERCMPFDACYIYAAPEPSGAKYQRWRLFLHRSDQKAQHLHSWWILRQPRTIFDGKTYTAASTKPCMSIWVFMTQKSDLANCRLALRAHKWASFPTSNKIESDLLSFNNASDSLGKQCSRLFVPSPVPSFTIRSSSRRWDSTDVTPVGKIPPDSCELQYFVCVEGVAIRGEKFIIGREEKIVAVHVSQQKEAWGDRIWVTSQYPFL